MIGVFILIIFVFVIFVILTSGTKSAQNKTKPRLRARKVDYTQELLPSGLGFKSSMTL